MSNKYFFFLLVGLSLIISNAACGFFLVRGSGNVVSEVREVSGFNRISVSSGMQLYLYQDNTESLTIEAEDNILPYIESIIDDGLLIVKYERGRSFNTQHPVRIHVSLLTISEILASGGSRVQSKNLVSDSLSLVLSGGGTAELMSLETGSLNANLSGGSHGIFSGSAPEQYVSVSGGGRYVAGELESNTVVISLSGGAGATVWVNEKIEATLSGGSLLEYFGSPMISEDLSGGSSIHPRGER